MNEDAVPLPSAPRAVLAPNAILQPPLSRRGHGPGLILVIPASYGAYGKNNETLDPEPVQKWAEEGYAVVEVAFDIALSGDSTAVDGVIKNALYGLHSFDKCDDKEKFGILVYGSKSDYAPAFNDTLEAALSAYKEILAAIVYDHWTIHAAKGTLFHLTGRDLVKPTSDAVSKFYSYPEASSPGFIYPSHVDFKVSSAGIAHTRSLTFLKRHLDGPIFDLEQIWEEHTYYEFAERSVAKTMGTMVQEPYVNHVPTVSAQLVPFKHRSTLLK
ncbi:acetylcholinesterase activity protein [Paecilomyces lecythidis]